MLIKIPFRTPRITQITNLRRVHGYPGGLHAQAAEEAKRATKPSGTIKIMRPKIINACSDINNTLLEMLTPGYADEACEDDLLKARGLIDDLIRELREIQENKPSKSAAGPSTGDLKSLSIDSKGPTDNKKIEETLDNIIVGSIIMIAVSGLMNVDMEYVVLFCSPILLIASLMRLSILFA